MKKILISFRQSEEGAVTVDWVVLTAAIIGVAIGAINQVGAATNALAENTADGMTAISIGTGNNGGGT